MYTQCPDCGTVFRVTAQALRAAQGEVRCGICSVVFNALDALREQPAAETARSVPGEDTITVEELPGTEVIELSDGEAPEAAEPPPVPFILPDGDADSPPPVGDAAATQTGVADSADGAVADEPTGRIGEDAALEFRGTVEDLERLFVSIDSPTAGPVPSSSELEDRGEGRVIQFRHAMEEIASSDLSGIEVTESEGEWTGKAQTPEPGETAVPDPAQIAAVLAVRRPRDKSGVSPSDSTAAGMPASVEDRELGDLDRTDEFPILVLDEQDELKVVFDEADRHDRSVDEEADAHEESAIDVAGIPIPAELRRDTALAADEFFASRIEPAAEEGPSRWPWLVAGVALLLLAGAQALHHWRSELVREPVFGPWLLQAYALLGLPLAPPADLDAFELRQLGAASDAARSGRLKLRASIVNGAAFAQPFPLLRLSLQDRFGTTIGARDLEPAEYLPGGQVPPSGLMAPGQRADAEVVFVDPGRDAVGFELDVCLREGDAVRCSADPLPGQP